MDTIKEKIEEKIKEKRELLAADPVAGTLPNRISELVLGAAKDYAEWGYGLASEEIRKKDEEIARLREKNKNLTLRLASFTTGNA